MTAAESDQFSAVICHRPTMTAAESDQFGAVICYRPTMTAAESDQFGANIYHRPTLSAIENDNSREKDRRPSINNYHQTIGNRQILLKTSWFKRSY